MACFDKNGVEFSDDRKTLVKCPKVFQGGYIIPNSVTRIGKSAFWCCSGLTSVTIPNSVTSIGKSAFSDCTGLTSVTIPNSVTSIGRSAFLGCSGLTSVTIPNSVTSIGEGAFSCCTGLTTINVSNDNPNYIAKDGVLFNKQLTTLIQYPSRKQGAYAIPNSVTSIGEGAFSCCTGLTSIEIPNSVTSIGDEAFRECTSLISITLPNSVKSIGKEAFDDCGSLKNIIVPLGQEDRFCEIEGLKEHADIIRKTSEQQIMFYEKPFVEMLSFNIDQLNYRYTVLQSIKTNDPQRRHEYLMVFDSFLVLFRALYLENGNKQYSVQNYFTEKGLPEKAQAINNFLDTLVFEWHPDLTIRKMLKFIADKFICHADPISKEDLAQSNFYMSHLSNPYTKINLQFIMDNLNALIK